MGELVEVDTLTSNHSFIAFSAQHEGQKKPHFFMCKIILGLFCAIVGLFINHSLVVAAGVVASSLCLMPHIV